MLSKLARKLPVFPQVGNQRSSLYIGNLMEFIRLMVKNEEQGIFWPQNKEYFNTTQLAKTIAQVNGKNLLLIPGVGWLLKLMSRVTGLVNKAFGSMSYEESMSEYTENYRLYTLQESVVLTEESK